MIKNRSPTLAIGLLRWLAHDIVRWLRQTRGRDDVWTREHGLADAERTFAELPPGRGLIEPGTADDALARDRLSKLPVFHGKRPGSLLEAVGEKVRLVRVDRRGAVVSHRELDRALLVLLEGQASVRNTSNEVLGRFDGASSHAAERVIGELGFLTSTGRDGTVIADTDCLLLEIPHASAPWLLQTDADLAFRVHLALLRTVCWRLDEVDADRSRTAAILAGDLEAWLAD